MGGQKDMNAQKYTQKSLEAVRLAQDQTLDRKSVV